MANKKKDNYAGIAPGVVDTSDHSDFVRANTGPIESDAVTVLKGARPETATVEWHPSETQAREAVEAAKRRDSIDAQER